MRWRRSWVPATDCRLRVWLRLLLPAGICRLLAPLLAIWRLVCRLRIRVAGSLIAAPGRLLLIRLLLVACRLLLLVVLLPLLLLLGCRHLGPLLILAPLLLLLWLQGWRCRLLFISSLLLSELPLLLYAVIATRLVLLRRRGRCSCLWIWVLLPCLRRLSVWWERHSRRILWQWRWFIRWRRRLDGRRSIVLQLRRQGRLLRRQWDGRALLGRRWVVCRRLRLLLLQPKGVCCWWPIALRLWRLRCERHAAAAAAW